MSTDVLVVLCTFPAGDAAAKVAERLVEEQLAACVNIVSGVRSVFRWKGKVTREEEVVAIIKTTADRFATLKVRLIELDHLTVLQPRRRPRLALFRNRRLRPCLHHRRLSLPRPRGAAAIVQSRSPACPCDVQSAAGSRRARLS